MSYYLNPFFADYIGNMVLADRKQVIEFKCPGNFGRGEDFVIVWNEGPYNVASPNNHLGIQVAIDNDFRNWVELVFDLSLGTYANGNTAATANEIAAYLTSCSQFSGYFMAISGTAPLFADGGHRLKIKQRFPVNRMKFYVETFGAEQALRFNARAGVGQGMTYFARHTVANLPNFTDGMGTLVLLNPNQTDNQYDPLYLTNTNYTADQLVITNAADAKGNLLGFDYTQVLPDWQLLKGQSGAFNCQIITTDHSNGDRISQIVEFQTGAKAGDLARKIEYYYASSNSGSNPNGVYELPYVLTSDDLATLTTSPSSIT